MKEEGIMSFKKIALAALIMLAQPVSSINAGHHSSDDNSGIAIALAVGGAALAGAGIYALCDWLFSRTDQQVLSDANTLIASIDARYTRLYEIFINHLGDRNTFSAASYTMPLLENIEYAELKNVSIGSYIANVSSSVLALHKEHACIGKRLAALEKRMHKDPQAGFMHRELQQASAKLNKRLVRLRSMQNFLEYHQPFFELLGANTAIYQKHCAILAQLAYVMQYPAALAGLAPLIMASKDMQGQRFVYLSYYNQLTSDIRRLHNALHAVRVAYEPLASSSAALERDLELLSGIIRSSDRYAQEYHQHEVEEAQRKQLEIQQAMLKAEQEKAAAERERLRLLAEQNRLEAKKLELKRQELDQKGETVIIINNR